MPDAKSETRARLMREGPQCSEGAAR
jgi:hypothetical protein